MQSLLLIFLLAGCAPVKYVSNAPPLPPKVTQCRWDVAAKTFEGDAACEKFLRDYVGARVGK